MPEKTKENKELKEKKEAVAKKTTKSSHTGSTKKSNSSSKKKTVSSKKVSPKATDAKATTKTKKTASTSKKTSSDKAAKTNAKKANDTKKETSSKKTQTKPKTDSKNAKKVEKKKDVVKEENIIEKIKSFLAKIVAMQEEAKLEAERKKEKNKSTNNENKIDNHKKNEAQEQTSYMLEYYDLPYRYNETIVKILAQTPKKLFVYWDISDSDRQKYLKAFGERFFEETYPVLLVHNEEKNYTFEVPINDFANSWYLDINDAKSKYVIELGRKFRTKPEIVNIATTEETQDVVLHNDYVPIIKSNVLEVPNDCILFENLPRKILYRNVKNNQENFVDIENIGFIKDIEHIYSINDLYKEFYKDEIEEENMLDLLNPSSMSSSTFK